MPVARQLDSPLTMIVNNGALIRSKEASICGISCAEHGRTSSRTNRRAPRRAVISTGQLENQLMLEVLDPDDSMLYAYYHETWSSSGWRSLGNAA